MAYTIYAYTAFPYHLGRAEIALHSADLRMCLVSSSYVFDQDAHEDYADVTNELTTANGYTVGGQSLTGVTWTKDNATGRTRLTANSPAWTAGSGQTLTAAGAVLRKYDATAGSSWLMFYLDFGGNRSASNEVFRINPDATDGFGYLAV